MLILKDFARKWFPKIHHLFYDLAKSCLQKWLFNNQENITLYSTMLTWKDLFSRCNMERNCHYNMKNMCPWHTNCKGFWLHPNPNHHTSYTGLFVRCSGIQLHITSHKFTCSEIEWDRTSLTCSKSSISSSSLLFTGRFRE